MLYSGQETAVLTNIVLDIKYTKAVHLFQNNKKVVLFTDVNKVGWK